jgi:hypothetical protein
MYSLERDASTNSLLRDGALSQFVPSSRKAACAQIPQTAAIFFLMVTVEYCPCNICPGFYVFDKGDPYSRLASDIDKAVWLLFPGILVWMIYYFKATRHARSLNIVA